MKIEAKVCERLLRDKVIQEEEKEIIQYGLHQGGALFVNICTLMIVCTTMGCYTRFLVFNIFLAIKNICWGISCGYGKKVLFFIYFNGNCYFFDSSFF